MATSELMLPSVYRTACARFDLLSGAEVELSKNFTNTLVTTRLCLCSTQKYRQINAA